MVLPYIKIDLGKIRHNARLIVEKCQQRGIKVVGVTKCCLGSPEIAQAMLAGGAEVIGDSRLPNLLRLRKAGIKEQLMMLRQPMMEEISAVVSSANISLVSELAVIALLARAAALAGKVHQVILMVEVGNLREGILPEQVLDFTKKIIKLDGIKLLGIGTNVGCCAGATPTAQGLRLLVELAEELERVTEFPLEVVSGGTSSSWNLLEANLVPSRINQFRIGEGILLGQEAANYQPIQGTFQDAFWLYAEVVEVREKPVSFASGVGDKDKGQRMRRQAIVALGRQDIGISDGLVAYPRGIRVLRASSDHLVLDLTSCEIDVKVGTIIHFRPNYNSLLAAMTSPFVQKRYHKGVAKHSCIF